jgi:hypothetical protein
MLLAYFKVIFWANGDEFVECLAVESFCQNIYFGCWLVDRDVGVASVDAERNSIKFLHKHLFNDG